MSEVTPEKNDSVRHRRPYTEAPIDVLQAFERDAGGLRALHAALAEIKSAIELGRLAARVAIEANDIDDFREVDWDAVCTALERAHGRAERLGGAAGYAASEVVADEDSPDV